MTNLRKGSLSADFSGKTFQLCLTLGALAELEHAFAATDILSLAERFEKGRFSSSEVITILTAAMRGGGHEVSREEVAGLNHEKGFLGCIEVVQQLLVITFGGHIAN